MLQGIATHRTNHPVPHGAFALLPLPPTSAAIPLLLRRILFLTSTIKQTHQSTSDFFNFPKKICVTVLFEPATTAHMRSDNVLCARASALCDAQRPFQSVPAHPRITTVTPSRTSQSKGGGQRMECWYMI